jgi:hypothetical protein
VAVQDQTIITYYCKNKILKEKIDSKCQLCKQHEETVDHQTSGCSILVNNEFLTRHDKVCVPLCSSVCKAPGTEMTDKWYTLLPKPVYEQEVVTVFWNQAVHTDREVTASRQDIIINNKKEKRCILITVFIGIKGLSSR